MVAWDGRMGHHPVHNATAVSEGLRTAARTACANWSEAEAEEEAEAEVEAEAEASHRWHRR